MRTRRNRDYILRSDSITQNTRRNLVSGRLRPRSAGTRPCPRQLAARRQRKNYTGDFVCSNPCDLYYLTTPSNSYSDETKHNVRMRTGQFLDEPDDVVGLSFSFIRLSIGLHIATIRLPMQTRLLWQRWPGLISQGYGMPYVFLYLSGHSYYIQGRPLVTIFFK